MGIEDLDLSKVDQIHILACGTAFLSGLVGKYAIEKHDRIPTNVELASEFRYRQPVVTDRTLTVLVLSLVKLLTLLSALNMSKSRSQTFSVCNVKYSSITRESNGTLLMEAGPEIGVCLD